MTCINCGHNGEGRFCSNCSQPLHVKRLTFKEGFLDFWARIYGFDGMFPRTFRDLTLRPGFAAREFINGNRARYYGPVGYFFLMITCFLLLLSIMDLSFVDYMKSMQEDLPYGGGGENVQQKVRQFVADNIKIIAFLIVPFQAFTSRYIFFRKQGLNFIEHSVLPLYMLGHWYWISMIEAILFKYTGFTMGSQLNTLLVSLYMGYGYVSFVPDQPKVKVFFKGFGLYYVSFLLFVTIMLIVALSLVFILLAVDPGSLDAIRPSKNL